jgi:uncharacterized protein YggE
MRLLIYLQGGKMSNKFISFVAILLVFIAFIVVSVDRDESSTDRIAQMLPHTGNSTTPSVEVQVSESKKYEANEFVTLAMLELHGKDKELLFKQLTSRRTSIFNQLKSLDVSEYDIEQNSVEMRKEWSYDKGTRSLTGYVVCQYFAIKTSSRVTAAAVIAALSAELDVEINHTTASLKNEAELKKEIILTAGKKALEKATNYAESVGGKLGKVLSVSENGANGVFHGRTVLGASKYDMLDAAGAGNLSAVADSVEIRASIHLVAELLQ